MEKDIRYLFHLKLQYIEQIKQIESMLNRKIQQNHLEFNNVNKLFDHLSSPDVLANFTVEQRNNIELMKKEIEDAKAGLYDKKSKIEDKNIFESESNKSIPESSSLCRSDSSSACGTYDIVSSHKELLNFNNGQEKYIVFGENQLEDEKGICSLDYLRDCESKSQGSDICLANSSNDTIQDTIDEINKLKEAKDTVACQIRAVQNEAAEYANEKRDELFKKSRELEILKQRFSLLNEVKKYLIEKCEKISLKYEDLNSFNKISLHKDSEISKSCIDSLSSASGCSSANNEISNLHEDPEMPNEGNDNLSSGNESSSGTLNVAEARIISILSVFLHRHQNGVNIENIRIFLDQMNVSLAPEDITNLMKRFPSVFEQQTLTTDNKLEKKWFNIGF